MSFTPEQKDTMVPPLEADTPALVAAMIRSVKDRIRFARTPTSVEQSLLRATRNPDLSDSEMDQLRAYADKRLLFIRGIK